MLLPTFLLFSALSFLPAILAHIPQAEHHRSLANGLEQRAPNIGRYDFYIPGYAVHLMSTLGINGKVYFMDKHFMEPFNTSGSYELDPSLVGGPDWESAWRTLHVLDEIVCSASLVLPDKAGRIVNIAGYTGSSYVGVRLLTPSGTYGVQGDTDWEQDPTNLALQRPRWYPTAVVMANGSILIVAGADSDNGNIQPNLEILPRIPGGDTTVYLEFLTQSNPWNGYPFVHVLASGNIFIAYYNDARILDKTTFGTVSIMPKIPGTAADVFDAARTYPWAGSAIMLPIKAPYTAPVTILICGGSTFTQIGLDTCVSITPEAPLPQWTVETMPSTRVLACFAPLADGTFLIINGAHLGISGWRNARDPNFTPVLYNPSLPIGLRMTELASTNIARLYHSEASLILDGSVLISGSDPQDYGFPQEYRIERFSPPYLLNGQIRPGFTLPVKDWDYKLGYRIVLKGTASTSMKIVLIGAVSSTHGNVMGTRTIFPAMKCVGFGCTVFAPTNAEICPPGWFMIFILDGPTPSLGQWIRIGGDPAQLGNWPPGPAFVRPGV